MGYFSNPSELIGIAIPNSLNQLNLNTSQMYIISASIKHR